MPAVRSGPSGSTGSRRRSSSARVEPARGFDPRERVLTGLAEAPHTHQVSLRARAEPAEVLAALPPGIATVHDLDAADPDAGRGWVRVRIQADRLEWLPAVLAGLAHPFVVEGPEELKVLVQRLARRLEAAAEPPLRSGRREPLPRLGREDVGLARLRDHMDDLADLRAHPLVGVDRDPLRRHPVLLLSADRDAVDERLRTERLDQLDLEVDPVVGARVDEMP